MEKIEIFQSTPPGKFATTVRVGKWEKVLDQVPVDGAWYHILSTSAKSAGARAHYLRSHFPGWEFVSRSTSEGGSVWVRKIKSEVEVESEQ